MKPLHSFLIKNHVKSNKEADIKEIQDYIADRFWFMYPAYEYNKIKYTIDKDSKGYYIDTELTSESLRCGSSGKLGLKNYKDFFTTIVDKYNKLDKKNCPYFRWRNHTGNLSIPENIQQLESLEGLPKEIDQLHIGEMVACQSKSLDLCDLHIKKLKLYNVGNINLIGNPRVDEIVWFGYNGKKPKITFNCNNMHKG